MVWNSSQHLFNESWLEKYITFTYASIQFKTSFYLMHLLDFLLIFQWVKQEKEGLDSIAHPEISVVFCGRHQCTEAHQNVFVN